MYQIEQHFNCGLIVGMEDGNEGLRILRVQLFVFDHRCQWSIPI